MIKRPAPSELLTLWPYAVVLLFIATIYFGVGSQPILRTTGDEKVYIAQALEMTERGSWFVQTLAGEPSYYKGPLFYQLLRIGFVIFGQESMWATLWMNFLGVAIAAASLTFLAVRTSKSSGFGAFVGTAFAGACGLYSHIFAAQMEALLVAMYAVAFVLLELWRRQCARQEKPVVLPFLFWGLVAVAGLLKSPIHSVLLGVGFILTAFIHKELNSEVMRRRILLAVGIGILLGLAYYSVALIVDHRAFVDTYIVREMLARGANGKGIFEVSAPVFSIYLFPMLLFAWVGFLYALTNWSKSLQDDDRKSILTAGGLSFPTFVFFALHGYRSEIYALPILSMVLWTGCLGWGLARDAWPKISSYAYVLTILVASIVPLVVLFFQMWFSPDARWWPSWIGYLAGAVIVQFAWSMWRTRNGHRDFRSNYLPVLFTPWFLLIGATLYALGARDLLDFKDFLAGQSLTSKIGYYNVHRHTWSEWGALGIWARHKVDGLHSESAVKQYLTTGGQVVVPGRQHLDKLQADLGYVPLKIEEWKRWKIHGAVKGDTSLLDALRSRDVAPLQDRYFIVALKPTTRQQVNN